MGCIRNGKDEKDDPTGKLKKIDDIIPQKRGQSPEDRAKDIEAGLDWVRNGQPKGPSDDDTPPWEQFDKMDSGLITRRSPPQRQKDLEDVMNCIRNVKDEKDDPTGEFKKIDQIILPRKVVKVLKTVPRISRVLWIGPEMNNRDLCRKTMM